MGQGLSLLLDGPGGLAGSGKAGGSEESLELVSAVLILSVRTLGGERGQSSGGVA